MSSYQSWKLRPEYLALFVLWVFRISCCSLGNTIFIRATSSSAWGRVARKKEGGGVLEANTGVLKELAMREAQLMAKVSQVKEDALKLVSDAESKAKQVLAKAEADVSALEAEYKQKREGEEKSIFEAGIAAAKTAADAVSSAAAGKIAGAVQVIVSKVLP